MRADSALQNAPKINGRTRKRATRLLRHINARVILTTKQAKRLDQFCDQGILVSTRSGRTHHIVYETSHNLRASRIIPELQLAA